MATRARRDARFQLSRLCMYTATLCISLLSHSSPLTTFLSPTSMEGIFRKKTPISLEFPRSSIQNPFNLVLGTSETNSSSEHHPVNILSLRTTTLLLRQKTSLTLGMTILLSSEQRYSRQGHGRQVHCLLYW